MSTELLKMPSIADLKALGLEDMTLSKDDLYDLLEEEVFAAISQAVWELLAPYEDLWKRTRDEKIVEVCALYDEHAAKIFEILGPGPLRHKVAWGELASGDAEGVRDCLEGVAYQLNPGEHLMRWHHDYLWFLLDVTGVRHVQPSEVSSDLDAEKCASYSSYVVVDGVTHTRTHRDGGPGGCGISVTSPTWQLKTPDYLFNAVKEHDAELKQAWVQFNRVKKTAKRSRMKMFKALLRTMDSNRAQMLDHLVRSVAQKPLDVIAGTGK